MPRAASSLSRSARAHGSRRRGGRVLAGARGCAGVAAARPCARSSPPRAAAGLRVVLRPPPPAALGRAGCSLNRPRPEGEGLKSGPPPRLHLLGGQPLGARRGDRRSPSRARLPTLSLERRRRPYSPFPIGLRGGLNPLSPADGGALRKGGGAVLPRPRLRPPGSPQSPASPVGQAWAGPVLFPSGNSESSVRGPGKECLLPLPKVGAPGG